MSWLWDGWRGRTVAEKTLGRLHHPRWASVGSILTGTTRASSRACALATPPLREHLDGFHGQADGAGRGSRAGEVFAELLCVGEARAEGAHEAPMEVVRRAGQAVAEPVAFLLFEDETDALRVVEGLPRTTCRESRNASASGRCRPHPRRPGGSGDAASRGRRRF